MAQHGGGKAPRLGSGERFARLERQIATKGGVRNPAAVAAAVGRKKFGKKRFQELSSAGRRRAAEARERLRQLRQS